MTSLINILEATYEKNLRLIEVEAAVVVGVNAALVHPVNPEQISNLATPN